MSNPITETGGLEPVRPVNSHSMKFDGTVTYGNLITAGCALVSIAVGWGMLSARLDATDSRATAQRVEFVQITTDLKEGMKEQRTEMRELQKSVSAINTDTALIRGRLAGGDTTTRGASK